MDSRVWIIKLEESGCCGSCGNHIVYIYIYLYMYVDSSSGDDEDTDEENPRVILSEELLLCFDKNFSSKRWLKLSPRTQKLISSICAIKVKTGKGKGKRSNRSLSLDRHHYLFACRGLHSLFFSPRSSFESQDSAMVDFIAIYQKTRYYKLAKVLYMYRWIVLSVLN